MVPPYKGHWALENSFSVCGSHIAGCLHDSLLKHPDDALNSSPISLLIKLLGSNYNAIPPLAAISALYFIQYPYCSPETLESKLCSVSARIRWSFHITESVKNTNLAFLSICRKAGRWHSELPCLPKCLRNESNFSNRRNDFFLLASSSKHIVWKNLNNNNNKKMFFLNVAKWQTLEQLIQIVYLKKNI